MMVEVSMDAVGGLAVLLCCLRLDCNSDELRALKPPSLLSDLACAASRC